MSAYYTDSKGASVEIATMAFPHLISAHKKAVASEERKHTHAHAMGEDYDNPAREAEIDAMKAEIDRREVEYAAQQEAASGDAPNT